VVRCRACAWPRRPQRVENLRLLTPAELDALLLHEDADFLAFNKPGDIPCHPSKAGPWSSLAGAVREHFRLDAARLAFRLDRETSGVVIFAKNPRAASRLQTAVQNRLVAKTYLAILAGRLAAPVTVDQPLGPDVHSPVFIKSCVTTLDAQTAVTRFTPLATDNAFTLAEVVPETGRKHQIRAHAQWLGHPVVGDKIYGPDALLYLDFVERGLTPELAARLILPRQALHCARMDLRPAGFDLVLDAPFPADLAAFRALHFPGSVSRA
jgi:23S rRNA pseudouridine1911/1915/1917 synthase